MVRYNNNRAIGEEVGNIENDRFLFVERISYLYLFKPFVHYHIRIDEEGVGIKVGGLES